MLVAAFVSFFSVWLLIRHLPEHIVRRLVGHMGLVDLLLHGTILWLFLGTSTMGLLQAEAAGICFSLYLRFYRWSFGYERWIGSERRWVRFSGQFTSHADRAAHHALNATTSTARS